MPTIKPIFALLTITLITACSSDAAPLDDAGIKGFDSDDNQDQGQDAGQDAGARLDLGGVADLPAQGTCANVQISAGEAPLAVDILVVVDNSSSMSHEVAQVQQHLNGFSHQIIQSGVDARVVLLSLYPPSPYGICIDPPLGGGGCPDDDNNPPMFIHIDQEISSSDSLGRLIHRAPDWLPWSRPAAATHVLVVSDDESYMKPAEFLSKFFALSPSLHDLRFHAVVSVQECKFAFNIGQTYIDLAAMTGGTVGDICDQAFGPIFDALATEVTSFALPCAVEIPPPPDGETFDPELVTVAFTDGADSHPIAQVDGLAQCDPNHGGWYFDDPSAPASIVMCPQTCARIQGVEQASLEVWFSCEPKFAE